ncbi:MAG: porin family protein [Gammaproteobacteria bacterium]|nr:porin family protein [Gammaproteobacteria bacterium]
MKRFNLLLSMMIVSLTSAHAQGVYVGGSLGLKSVLDHSNFNIGPISLPIDIPIDIAARAKQDMGWFGATGTLYVGNTWAFPNSFYLSVEGNVEFNSVIIDNSFNLQVNPIINNISVVNSRVNVKNSYGISLLPGYKVNENLLAYARAGIVYGKIQTMVSTPLGESNKTFGKVGTLLGVGLDYHIAQHVNLRSEYVYTVYSSVSQDFSAIINVPEAISLTFPLRETHFIRSGAFNLGVTYSFC